MSAPLAFATVVEGTTLDMDVEIVPGVVGYAIESKDGTVWIPAIGAKVEGDGRVGAFLNALPTDRTIKFPTVISRRLAGMLGRRGFTFREEPDVDVWVREAVQL